MIKILFICHGNICRSPMAACLLRHLARERGLEGELYTDSAATSREEIGAPMYPPARRKLKEAGVPIDGHRARQMTREDYDSFDLLLAMDSANVRNIIRIAGGDPEGKIRRLLDGTLRPRDIADPWYTGNFDDTYEDLLEGCTAVLEELTGEGKIRSAPVLP